MAKNFRVYLRVLTNQVSDLDDLWSEEAEKRLKAYRDGRLECIPMEDVFEEG